MQKLTIGKKIALGFGALILIAALLGGIAIFSMKAVQTEAQTLAEGYVPESEVAGDLQDAFAKTVLAIRSYGFTADNAYLDEARKSLVEVHKQQLAAQALSKAHPELIKLGENLKAIEPALARFEGFVDQTESENKDIVLAREKLNQTAAGFITNIDQLIAGQKSRQETEIKAATEAPKLQQRADKLALANSIRDEGEAARIAIFKSQVLRDPKLIEEGLARFDVMDKQFDSLQAMLTVQQDIDELKQIKVDAHAYREAMTAIRDDSAALGDTTQKRIAAMGSVAALVQDTQDTGMKGTVEAATGSMQTLVAASATIKIGLAVALLIAIVIAFVIIRNSNRVLTHVAHALEDGSNQIVAASSQVSSASQMLAEGASEQASSLEETSSSLEEMASMTKRNSDNARQANELAKEAREAADKGVGDMQTMAAAMDAIKVSSDDIAKIIKTIDEIAFQTNILALNAAVEAARAGEAGMGFAVVADEVRNLSQRCAQAAKETAGKIEGAIVRTGQGVEISSKVAAVLNEIVAKIRRVDELVTEVAGASNEQTDGITQINSAVSQMDNVTQNTAATAEESAAAAQELNAQAEIMKQSVAELLQLVGGRTTAGAPAPAMRRQEAAVRRPVRAATVALPPPVANTGIVSWNEEKMATGVSSVDTQHQELIRRINELHADCLAGRAREELMEHLSFLGEYAQSHFASEEKIMETHRCSARGPNKAAHAKFLQDYGRVVGMVKENGASTKAAIELKRMLGDWLTSHICRIDVALRDCPGAQAADVASPAQRRGQTPAAANFENF